MANTNQTHTVRGHLKAVARSTRPEDVPDLIGLFTRVIEETAVDHERKREIGRRMKLLRERSPHTQESLADLLGMTLRGYQKAELTGSISYTKLEKLAEIHRVSVDHFYAPATDDATQLDRVEAKLDLLLAHFGLSQPGEVDHAEEAVRAAEDAVAQARAREQAGAPKAQPKKRPSRAA